jgi:hypothetical protein
MGNTSNTPTTIEPLVVQNKPYLDSRVYQAKACESKQPHQLVICAPPKTEHSTGYIPRPPLKIDIHSPHYDKITVGIISAIFPLGVDNIVYEYVDGLQKRILLKEATKSRQQNGNRWSKKTYIIPRMSTKRVMFEVCMDLSVDDPISRNHIKFGHLFGCRSSYHILQLLVNLPMFPKLTCLEMKNLSPHNNYMGKFKMPPQVTTLYLKRASMNTINTLPETIKVVYVETFDESQPLKAKAFTFEGRIIKGKEFYSHEIEIVSRKNKRYHF